MCAAPKGNKFALGLTKTGRPPIYATPQQMIDKIEEYLVWIQGEYHTEKATRTNKETKEKEEYEYEVCDRQPESLTITGLILFLGFDARSSFYDYEKKEDFSYIVKRAKALVEHKYENMLDGQNVTGPIFALKNMGWKDKQEEAEDKQQTLRVEIIRSKRADSSD